VVAEFRRALHDPEHLPTRPVVARLVDLLRSNLAQWNLEDEARGPGADDAAVAQAKRAIDELNAGRHHIVEEIDAAINGAVTQSASAPLATESPAMAFDRLSVLVIRIHHTERDAGRYAARLPVLYRQLADLQEAIDGLIAGVRDVTRRFVPYQSMKLYGE
jgi:ABC-type transporter Mla subunit MlaD